MNMVLRKNCAKKKQNPQILVFVGIHDTVDK